MKKKSLSCVKTYNPNTVWFKGISPLPIPHQKCLDFTIGIYSNSTALSSVQPYCVRGIEIVVWRHLFCSQFFRIYSKLRSVIRNGKICYWMSAMWKVSWGFQFYFREEENSLFLRSCYWCKGRETLFQNLSALWKHSCLWPVQGWKGKVPGMSWTN